MDHGRGDHHNIDIDQKINCILIKNLIFKYPSTEKKVIDNLSISINKGETMSEDNQVNQPQNDVQEAEVKQTQSDEKPTASFAAILAIGNPVALEANADDLETLGFISMITRRPFFGFTAN